MFAWFNFAHHPLCKNYQNEVFSINGMYLCKGCTEVYSSSIFIIILVALFNPLNYLHDFQLLLIALITAIPSFIGNFIHFKRRIIKDIIRIDLGIGIGIGLSELVLISDLLSKLVVFCVLIVIYGLFTITRSGLNNSDNSELCSNCQQFNDQACEHYKQVFYTEREYSHVLSDFIQKNLTVNKIESFGFTNSMQDD